MQVKREQRPEGPAENSLILVQVLKHDIPRGRYIPWIGYADLDQAESLEFGRWKLVEPARPFEADIWWHPWGWAPLEEVWMAVG